MSMLLQRDSPHTFIWILSRFKKRDPSKCRDIFPVATRENLTELKSRVHSELVDPLFLKKAINIKDEDNALEYKDDNLICCIEVYLKKLKQLGENAYNEFDEILKTFRSCYEKIIKKASKNARVDSLFSWILELDSKDFGATLAQCERDRDQLKNNRLKIELEMKGLNESAEDFDKTMSALFDKWKNCLEDLGEVETKIFRLKHNESQRMGLKIDMIERRLSGLKAARGKPGRHPKPFNVLTYHLINKCTRWRIDQHKRLRGKGPYVYRKKGQHGLERDWRLIIYLLLDIHLFSAELPEIKKFINKHGKKPADKALRVLQNMLWNSYKNFPPLQGWPFPREPSGAKKTKRSETGFRKLIVNNDGRLQIVRL